MVAALAKEEAPAECNPARAQPYGVSLLPGEGDRNLLQRAVDIGKLGIKVRSETVNHCDDGQRDTGRDQAIFNCGGTRFIGKEIQQNPLQ